MALLRHAGQDIELAFAHLIAITHFIRQKVPYLREKFTLCLRIDDITLYATISQTHDELFEPVSKSAIWLKHFAI